MKGGPFECKNIKFTLSVNESWPAAADQCHANVDDVCTDAASTQAITAAITRVGTLY